jgi:DNA-damage-inducible protein J
MASDTTVRARIDSETKAKAASVLEAMGLSVSDAVRLMITRVAKEGALPLTRSSRMPKQWKRWRRLGTMKS